MALLGDEGIEAVYNPLPNALHAEWTKRAADEGLHVLCEKPLAVDAEEAREVLTERAFVPGPDEEVSITYDPGGRRVTETFDPVDQYAREVEHFAECAESGGRPLVDRTETLGNAAVVDAIFDSADRGERVPVSIPGD